MHNIPRHSLKNIELAAEELNLINEELGEDLPYLHQHPESFGSVALNVLDAVSISVVTKQPHTTTVDYMRTALVLGLSHFQSALYPGKSLVANIKDVQIHFRGVRNTAFIDPIQWTKLFFLAVILRDQVAVRELTNIPETLMRQSNLQGSEVDYEIVRFYKGIYDPNANIAQLLIDAMKATNPKNYEEERSDYFLNLKVPELTLYRCIFSDELEEYNERLAEAISLHRDFWAEKERAYDKEGWISYPLIAASVIAYGAKRFPIKVDSPYLPLWLVEHEF